MNNTFYRFAESEGDHAERLDTSFRTTRIKRKALLTLLNGKEYPGQPEWVKAMTQDQLTHRLCVAIQPNGVITHAADSRTLAELVEDSASTFSGTHHAVGANEKTEDRINAGHRIGNVPYPYQTGPDGTYLSDEWHRALVEAFQMLCSKQWSYTDVAGHLNDLSLESATGEPWNRHSALAFCQRAEHCGYAKRPKNPSDKHGPFNLYTPFALPTINPPVSLDDWLAANNLTTKFLGSLDR
jgi:hypothetical protein